MANEVSTLIGSGTVFATRQILTPANRGSNTVIPEGQGGFRQSTQVSLANPEDILSVDIWAASGVVINTVTAQVFGPHINTLPRTRKVVIENVGGQDAYIAPTEAGATAANGFTLAASAVTKPDARIELPLLHNAQVWATAASATTTLKIIVY